MRYRVFLSVDLDEGDDVRVRRSALKLKELLKQPIVQMAIASEGIQLANGDGALTVYRPALLRR